MTPFLRITALALACSTPLAAQMAMKPINGGLPSVSPDGRYIAFSARRDVSKPGEIFVINADGTGERRIAAGSGMPLWVNNGTMLFYTSPNATMSNMAMEASALDGSRTTSPPMPAGGRGYAISPDGRMLTYSKGMPPSIELVVSTNDGKDPRAIVTGPGMAFNGVFSPDGKRIAYARSDTLRNMQMWIINTDGTGNRQISNFSAADGRPQWPSWAPDGKWIAVQSGDYRRDHPDSSTAHIWLLNVDSGEARKLAAHAKPYLDETPSFFPDGKRIAFQSDRTGRMEVWVMNVDGTGARQVTR